MKSSYFQWLTPPLGWKIAQSSSSDEIVFVNDYTDEEVSPFTIIALQLMCCVKVIPPK